MATRRPSERTKQVRFSDHLVTKVTEYVIGKHSNLRKVKRHGQRHPKTMRLAGKSRLAENLACEKDAYQYAQEEHMCATQHDCADHCDLRQAVSPQSRNAPGREGPHVHVQCEHGYVLISGTQDVNLQPECSKAECKAEGTQWLISQHLLPGPKEDVRLVGAINAACVNLPAMPFWQRDPTTAEWSHKPESTVVAGGQVFDARAELLRERESFTLDDVMAYIRDDSQQAYSVAFVGVGVGIGAIGTFKSRLFKPKWSAEINPVQQKIWVAMTRYSVSGRLFRARPCTATLGILANSDVALH